MLRDCTLFGVWYGARCVITGFPICSGADVAVVSGGIGFAV